MTSYNWDFIVRSGQCIHCQEQFTKRCPRSVKKATICEKVACLEAQKRLNATKGNRKKRILASKEIIVDGQYISSTPKPAREKG